MKKVISLTVLLLLLAVGVAIAWEHSASPRSSNTAATYLMDDPNDPNEPGEPDPQPEASLGIAHVLHLLEGPNEPNDPQPENL